MSSSTRVSMFVRKKYSIYQKYSFGSHPKLQKTKKKTTRYPNQWKLVLGLPQIVPRLVAKCLPAHKVTNIPAPRPPNVTSDVASPLDSGIVARYSSYFSHPLLPRSSEEGFARRSHHTGSSLWFLFGPSGPRIFFVHLSLDPSLPDINCSIDV